MAGLAYGGYELKRGDSDKKSTWGGAIRKQAPQNHVAELQRDLIELGFKTIKAVSGEFDIHTDWAVREFQCYSKLSNVAKSIPPKFMSMSNGLIYKGSVNGVVNWDTAHRIKHWLKNNWRCPVVIIAAKSKDVKSPSPKDMSRIWNIWHYNDVDASYRSFAWDFTGHYVKTERFHESVLGSYLGFKGTGGPSCDDKTKGSAIEEVCSQSLTGKEDKKLSAAEKSTAGVVGAVAAVECEGHFDTVNAYDTGSVSIGLCHWTLASGELGALLAYLLSKNKDVFDYYFGRFGLGVEKTWDPLRFNGLGTYNIKITREEGGGGRTPYKEDDGFNNYYRTYHWVYRFKMACRTSPELQRAMWDMVRFRIGNIRGMNVAVPGISPSGPIAIGDLVTSEKGMALLLRWHVKRPGDFSDKKLYRSKIISGAMNSASGLKWGDDPSKWHDRHESALVESIYKRIQEVGKDKSDALLVSSLQVKDNKGLSEKRQSFKFAKP